MMLFNDFIHKYNLKNKATSTIRFYQIISSIGIDNVDIFLRDRLFKPVLGIVNSHLTEGTLWVLFVHECYFDSYG